MSACLFTYSNAAIIDMSDDQLRALLTAQTPYLNPVDKNNRFECDQACGFGQNVQNATLELKAREYGDSATLTAYANREGFNSEDFVMRYAVIKSCQTNEPVKLVLYRGRLKVDE